MDRRRFLFALAPGLASVRRPAQAQGFEVSDWPGGVSTPALAADDPSGRHWQLSDFRGRVLVLNFWASWCEPCRAEMPALQQLPSVFGADRLALVGVNFRESPQSIARFAATAGLTLPLLLDPLGEVARAWGVRVFPTTVLIDRSGRARQRIRGEVDWRGPAARGWLVRLLAT